MESTLLIWFTIVFLVTRSVVFKGWILELSSAEAIHALVIIGTDTRSSITACLVVEIDITYSVSTGLAWTGVIKEFPILSIESTNLFVDNLSAA